MGDTASTAQKNATKLTGVLGQLRLLALSCSSCAEVAGDGATRPPPDIIGGWNIPSWNVTATSPVTCPHCFQFPLHRLAFPEPLNHQGWSRMCLIFYNCPIFHEYSRLGQAPQRKTFRDCQCSPLMHLMLFLLSNCVKAYKKVPNIEVKPLENLSLSLSILTAIFQVNLG